MPAANSSKFVPKSAVFWWEPEVSKENVASIFRVEKQAKQETT
jgi:hypothetical protein